MALNLFPVRIPIGRSMLADGSSLDVLMTPEFARALSDLLERIGGDSGMGVDEITSYLADLSARPEPPAPEQFQQPAPELSQVMAELSTLRQQLQDIQQQVGQRHVCTCSAGVADLEHLVMDPQTPVDWEHPGKIGFRTPNKGSFTILNSGVGAVGAPSFYLGTDTTTGLYRIGLNNWGYSVAGTKLLDYSANLVQIVGRLRVDTGTSALPAIYFNGDTGTGFYRIGVNNIGFALGGSMLVNWSSLNMFVDGTVEATNVFKSNRSTAGGPPLVVASAALVANLYAARAALADTATTATTATSANTANTLTSPTAFPANAVDLPTVITLANALKSAAVAKGL